MAEQKWTYQKLDENGRIKYAPKNDFDGSTTGHIVFNVTAWFDENPEERKRLGWVKHIRHDTKDIEYNRQTQYLINATKQIDEYTVEDDWKIMDKSEEMMRLEELIGPTWASDNDNIIIYGGN